MCRLRTTIPNLVLALMIVTVVPGPAGAGSYDDCVALVAADPTQAESEATLWVQSGGGAPARHCRALALQVLGAERKAAELMIAIATDDRTLPTEVRVDLLIEAGEIYLALYELSLGSSVASRALSIAPESRAALTLSAQIKAAQSDWLGAVGYLNGALASNQPEADLLVLRASAWRRLGNRVAARADLAWAAELAPDLSSVWLEQGALEAVSENFDAARAAWIKAIELDNESDGVVGEAARLRLQRMEADRAATSN